MRRTPGRSAFSRNSFEFYLAHPREIGEHSRKRIRREGRHRAVCDYLAGMTDRYVMQEHHRWLGTPA